MLQSFLIQSAKNFKQPFHLPDDALQELIIFGQLTLETYFFENMNGQPTDGLGTPTIAILIPHLSSCQVS